jgi:C-terminal processing protease CtpA/Prc
LNGSAMGRGLKKGIIWPLFGLVVFWAGIGGAQEKVFGGVGLQVVPTSRGDLVVLKVVEGSPAETGGLRPGDLIVQVDGFVLEGSDFTDVVSRYLWGEVGGSVTLKYLRPGEKGLHSVLLRRAPLNLDVAQPPGVRMLVPENN